MDEYNIRAQLVQIFNITDAVSVCLSSESLNLINLERERIGQNVKLSDCKFEDFESGIYSLNKCISYYKSQRSLNIFASRLKELQETYFDNLMFKLKVKSVDIGDEENDFDSVKAQLMISLIQSIATLPRPSRTEEMMEFAKKHAHLLDTYEYQNEEREANAESLAYTKTINYLNGTKSPLPNIVSNKSQVGNYSYDYTPQLNTVNYYPDGAAGRLRGANKVLYAESNPEIGTAERNFYRNSESGNVKFNAGKFDGDNEPLEALDSPLMNKGNNGPYDSKRTRSNESNPVIKINNLNHPEIGTEEYIGNNFKPGESSSVKNFRRNQENKTLLPNKPLSPVPMLSKDNKSAPPDEIIYPEAVGSGISPKRFATDVRIVSHKIVDNRGSKITVNRRYTDFVNLRYVLTEAYPSFRQRIPKLPPKRLIGNLDQQFLQSREHTLQYFIAYVTLHPIIGSSSYVKSWFLGSLDNKKTRSFLATTTSCEYGLEYSI
ncbi:hypothetical protein BB558_000357 [Smittium angustum]|uniref:Sorting nexin MVP1 n=1 Tax=Smittium angustum TaxID=133377 RepID=A0A2U1JER7_SMIAN|nr:hypothetical protein BB558_000357 [Smittium angustum]